MRLLLPWRHSTVGQTKLRRGRERKVVMVNEWGSYSGGASALSKHAAASHGQNNLTTEADAADNGLKRKGEPRRSCAPIEHTALQTVLASTSTASDLCEPRPSAARTARHRRRLHQHPQGPRHESNAHEIVQPISSIHSFSFIYMSTLLQPRPFAQTPDICSPQLLTPRFQK